MAEEIQDRDEKNEAAQPPAEQPAETAANEAPPAEGTAEPAEAPAPEAPPEAPQPPPPAEASDSEKMMTPEEAGLEYGVAVEDAGTLKKKVTVTVPERMVKAKREQMFGELRTSAQVPGFRKGRAPRRLLEKRFGKEVAHDVRNALVGDSMGTGVRKAELTILGEPEIDLEKIEVPEEGDLVYSFEVEVAPQFELPELKGIEVRKPVMEVTDAHVEEALERMRANEARYEPAEAPADERDVVKVDARITGQDIGEVKQSLTLRVAPGQVEGIPLVDLGKELAGKKAGESARLSVKIPNLHPNEVWRGKQADIELTVTEVQKRTVPPVDEAYATKAGFDSLADLRKQVAERMKSRVMYEGRRAMREQVRQYLLDQTDFELPEGVVERQSARVLQRRYVDLLSRGIAREQIDERLTEIQAMAAEEARRDLKLAFVLQKIADQQEIEVSDEEINARVAYMATLYERRPERLKQELMEDGSIQQVAESIREDKAIDKLLEAAKVTEVDAQAAEEQAKGEAQGEGEAAKPTEPSEPPAGENQDKPQE